MRKNTSVVLATRQPAKLIAMIILIVAVMVASFAPISGSLAAQEATPATQETSSVSDAALGYDPGLDRVAALDEVSQLLADEGYDERAVAAEQRAREIRFTEVENVFLPSTIALDDLENPEAASAVVPLFLGVGADGVADEDYIITEASDFDAARLLGVNFAPNLVYARGRGGEQDVTIQNGRIVFRGSVDFGPELSVEAGPEGQSVVPGTSVFPPAAVQPGAVADAEWSSAVVLPSGLVINAQVDANGTGVHDRVVEISAQERRVRLELLDGFQGVTSGTTIS